MYTNQGKIASIYADRFMHSFATAVKPVCQSITQTEKSRERGKGSKEWERREGRGRDRDRERKRVAYFCASFIK